MCTTRSSTEYHNLSERFSKQNKEFTKQYCSIYITRLEKMRQLLIEQITKKWGTKYPICKLHKLSEESYDMCIVIGTIFKDQKLKPSVLKQLAESNQVAPQPVGGHLTDDSDALFIEDELQRFHLLGLLKTGELVTGISCALLGSDVGKGKFMVEDYCFPDLRPRIERPLFADDMYVVFISGLDLINMEKSLLPLQLFFDWISGLIGDINNVKISKIVRLVIAGNSIRTKQEKNKVVLSMTTRSVETVGTIEAVRLLDAFLFQLCQIIDVDVMPGENDPSNHILPQKSMHHCMFPKSISYKSFNQVSNPYEFELENTRILGTSGQPVRDILRFCDIEDPLSVLESCLKWSHLAPTAPDTLGCYPFYESDPFIIENCPHIFFAGNQEKFATKLSTGKEAQSVRLICVPEFCESFTVGVLNLKNMDCFPITFNAM